MLRIPIRYVKREFVNNQHSIDTHLTTGVEQNVKVNTLVFIRR
jgi:cation transport regulator ChaC